MARPKRRDPDREKEEQPEFKLPSHFVPDFSVALPEWAENVSEDLIREANIKGSPGFEPGPDQAKQVEQMTALGMSDLDISAVLRIEPKLLRKYYKYEIETARSRINNAVAKVALQMALSGAVPDMTKFWLTHQGGWKATKAVEITGKDGGAIEFSEVKRRMIESIEAEIIDAEYEDRPRLAN